MAGYSPYHGTERHVAGGKRQDEFKALLESEFSDVAEFEQYSPTDFRIGGIRTEYKGRPNLFRADGKLKYTDIILDVSKVEANDLIVWGYEYPLTLQTRVCWYGISSGKHYRPEEPFVDPKRPEQVNDDYRVARDDLKYGTIAEVVQKITKHPHFVRKGSS